MIALAPTPVLETERLSLRAPAARDWPLWRDFSLSDRAAPIRPAEFSEPLAWRAFGHVIGHWVLRGFGQFIITRKGDDRAIGMCGPWQPVNWPEAELGWSIWDSAAEGTGIAFEAASAARDHAFRGLGWTTAVSYIAPANSRSAQLARRLGAVIDSAAAHPGDEPCLVFRHPAPEMPA